MFMKYDYQTVLNHCYGDTQEAWSKIKLSIEFYYPRRSNFIARGRLQSALKVGKALKARAKRKGLKLS